MTQEEFSDLQKGDRLRLMATEDEVAVVVHRRRRSGVEVLVYLTNGRYFSSYSVSTIEALQKVLTKGEEQNGKKEE